LRSKFITHESRLTLEGCTPHDPSNRQNVPIIGPIGAFFVSTIINEVINWNLLVFNVLSGLRNKMKIRENVWDVILVMEYLQCFYKNQWLPL